MFSRTTGSLLLALLCFLQHIIHAQNIIAHKEGVQSSKPFLSTTLSAKVIYSSVSSTSYLHFDTTRKSIFADILAQFLTKVFTEQQVYDLKIISVNIFDDHLLHNGQYNEGTYVGHLVINNDKLDEDEVQPAILTFSMVISAEYTSTNEMDSTISSENFRKMLIHVCDKFQSPLLQYMQKKLDDSYFGGVTSIVLGDFERVAVNQIQLTGLAAIEKRISSDTIFVYSIAAIVVGGIVFILLSCATVKQCRKVKEMKAARWRSNELGYFNSATLSSKNAGGVDDYLFDPLGNAIENYNMTAYSDGSYRDEPNMFWSGVPSNTIFPAPGAVALPVSYTEELYRLPRQHVFAPPGKIGVAIDVVNGQPVVHSVRLGSPLEKMLQPNDIIISIDDENVSCMNAADVTSKLVRKMDRVRKITFVRRMEC